MFSRSVRLRSLFAICALALATGPANAQWQNFSAPSANVVHIQNDPGGQIIGYQARYAQYRQSGVRVVITGQCLSSCTLVLSLPRKQVCAMPGAVLGFHAAWDIMTRGPSPDGTRMLMSGYPPNVRAWIKARGGLKRDFVYVKATTFVRPC